MSRRNLTVMATCLAVIVAAGVIWYNYWALCCGRCTVRTFFTPGPSGLSLMGLTGVGALLLGGLKVCRRRRIHRLRCACGQLGDPHWNYCPRCGEIRDS